MSKLLRGLRCVRGYIQIRIMHNGRYYHKNFGPDSPLAREYATKHLLEKRHEIRMGKFGITKELESKKFSEVAALFFAYWQKETNADGTSAHTPKAIKGMGYFISYLVDYFGKKAFESIRPVDVMDWREHRLKSVGGTSVDREQGVLSSIFSTIERLINIEKIPAFKLPLDPKTDKAWNPCSSIEKSETVKRNRIPTEYELKKLKLSFTNLGDGDGWEICKMALKSILSEADLRKLELGAVIDTERLKTGVPVHIPITVLQRLNWRNWRKRWEAARSEAGLSDLQFRDLRKKGGNHLIGKYDIKLVSQYFGHASVKTTERSYTIVEQEKMRPLAQELDTWVENI